jgi:hypothetical protein
MADPIGQLPWLDFPSGIFARRAGGKVATTAALTAMKAAQRADGMLVQVQGSGSGLPTLWVWDDASTETAGANILAADDAPATGRWKREGGALKITTIAGQDETSDTTIPLTGLAVGDELLAVIVFASGVPTARALTDFTISANTINVAANAANNAANKYLVAYIDKT